MAFNFKGTGFVKMWDMKNLFYTLFIVGSLISCKNNGNNEGDGDTKEEKDKKVTSRDLSISRENAYNDLFLDSMAVADYLQKNEFDEKTERRILSFYNSRNYQFAWFSSDGLTEQARGFWNLYSYDATHGNDSLPQDKKLDKKMDNLLAAESLSISEKDQSYINTELTLTHHLVEHTLKVYEDGFVKRKEMERFVPSKKVDAMFVADSLLTKKHKDDKYYEDVNDSYKRLKEQLKRYNDIAKNGGWPKIPADKKIYKIG
ncbi:MAG: L,D-transpeptidase family protein, partial [Segetibacter sp.]|nr:L,D-transpeptidase family protein [Segetibacter sp.]